MAPARTLRLATRASPLARWQAEWVGGLLRSAHPGIGVEMVKVTTGGDRRQDVPLWAIGGQGLFVKEVQAAVLEGRADAAVHSAKDLPSVSSPGLRLAAIARRGDPRDAMVGRRLADLDAGAMVATGSVRRRAQLAWLRPDLVFTNLRGNIATRLERVPEGGAVVVAVAALERLGRRAQAAEVLAPATMLPQVGQGAVAVECRADDQLTAGLLTAVDDPPTATAVTAERAFLARLPGGCDLPVGALARMDGDEVAMEALLASADGRVVLRRRARGGDPSAVGGGLADALLGGGRPLLEYRLPAAGR
ncbi:MAG TPA: hydroxymethylbilane synthase [Acidimicrobiales bacterium]|nr:hydroxymethylbilane synthase [Acidimicrobiales bacterium]